MELKSTVPRVGVAAFEELERHARGKEVTKKKREGEQNVGSSLVMAITYPDWATSSFKELCEALRA